MNKKLVISGIVILVAAAVLAGWYYKHSQAGKDTAQTTSTSKSAQNNYKGTPRKDAAPGASQGVASDNNGDTSGSGGANISSASGLITVAAPARNTTFKNGDTLRGTAAQSISQVQYRVIDDNSGVIAQGALNVVNGTYSGTLHFSPTATTGRIDVFDFDSSYQEENNIQIPVTLQK